MTDGKLKITYRKLAELNPYANNPRLNEDAVQPVMNSITEFGFKIPVIIDKDDVLVCGHTRVEAAKRLGMTEVPCIVADDLDDEQIKAFRLVDNQVSTLAGWDFPKLNIELDDLAAKGWEMEDFGFQRFDDVFEIPEDDPEDTPMEQVGEDQVEVPVVVTCFNEQDAKELMERMQDEGRYCRRLH